MRDQGPGYSSNNTQENPHPVPLKSTHRPFLNGTRRETLPPVLTIMVYTTHNLYIVVDEPNVCNQMRNA